MGTMSLKLLLLYLITPISGLTVVLFWIRLLVFLLLVLVSLLSRGFHVDRVRPEGEVQSCRGFCSVPGPLQSLQRAEMWGVISVLQSSSMMVGMVLLLTLWKGLLVLILRGVVWFHAVRDWAFFPGPPGLWDSEWVNIPASAVSADDVALWPHSPGLLVKWVSFLGSLHLPC